MSACERSTSRPQRGMGLIEVMVSVVIGLLLVLVIYQIYEVSEGQKRTITAGSDAQQNASYGLYVLARDIAIAGNGIAAAAATLDGCALLRPVPIVIAAGATDNDPDTLTVLYGGSSSLATPVPLMQQSTAQSYVVRAPVGFSADATDPDKTDVVVAVQGATCTLSKIKPGGVVVDPLNGFATISYTPVAGDMGAIYVAANASLVNLGQPTAMGRVVYTVDPTTLALRTQKQLPTVDPVTPLISDVVNLKAQYGVDSNCDGTLTWQAAAGPWSSVNVPTLPLPAAPPYCVPGVPSLRQIQAVRIAIVTRSAQHERDAVTAGPLTMFDGAVSMTLTGDEQHYRYKVLETVVPLRNALWNSSP